MSLREGHHFREWSLSCKLTGFERYEFWRRHNSSMSKKLRTQSALEDKFYGFEDKHHQKQRRIFIQGQVVSSGSKEKIGRPYNTMNYR